MPASDHWWSHLGLCPLWHLLLVSVLPWPSSSCLIITTLPNQNHLYCISSMALRHGTVGLLLTDFPCWRPAEWVKTWSRGRRLEVRTAELPGLRWTVVCDWVEGLAGDYSLVSRHFCRHNSKLNPHYDCKHYAVTRNLSCDCLDEI